MTLIREGSKVFVVIGEERHAVEPENYRAWSVMLDEGRRVYEDEARHAKWKADREEAEAKVRALVAATPGAWLVPVRSWSGTITGYDAAALGVDGRIVHAQYANDKDAPYCDLGGEAILAAPDDIWWRVVGGRVLHRVRRGDTGTYSVAACDGAQLRPTEVHGYRGDVKWKRCKKCEEVGNG